MSRIPTLILAVGLASLLVIGLGHGTASGGNGVRLSAAAQSLEGVDRSVTVFGDGSVLVQSPGLAQYWG